MSAAQEEYTQIKIGTVSEPDDFNPFSMTSGISYMVAGMMYEMLYTTGPEMEPYPQLAQSYHANEDGTIWTYYLAEDSYWHDGERVTAHDVAFTFNMIMDNPQDCALLGGYLNGFQDVTALDDFTVQITLEVAKATMLAIAVPILPEHLWTAVVEGDRINSVDLWDPMFFPDGPVGSGPMILVEYSKTMGYIRLLKQDPYHRLPGIEIDSINVDEILFVIYSNEASMAMALQVGEIDVVDGVPESLWYTLMQDPDIEGQTPAALDLTEVGFNCASEELRTSVDDMGRPNFPRAATNLETTNLSVRQAIAMVTNKTQIVEDILQGLAQEADSLIPTATPFWHYYVPEEEKWHFDIAAANELLNNSGYNHFDGSDFGFAGVRENETSGAKLEFELYYISATMTDELSAYTMANWCENIGVKLNLIGVSEGILYNMWFNLEYDMFIWNWQPDVDPAFLLSVLTTDEIPEDSSDITAWSDCYYSNLEYDQLYEDQLNAINPFERQTIVHEMQRIAYRDCPYICLWYPSSLIAYRTDVFTDFPDMERYGGATPDTIWFYFAVKPHEEGANTAPYNVDAGDDLTVYVGEEQTFSGSAEDLESSQDELNWSWECIEPDSSVMLLYGQTVNYTFENPGTVEVTLTVTDPMGLWDSDALMVTVTLPPPPLPPVADFTVTPELGYLGTAFTVDASSSYDFEDQLEELEVRWDWNNDGAWDTEWTTDKTACLWIFVAGEHTIVLEVRDSDGMTDTESHVVVVFDHSFEQGQFPERLFTIVNPDDSQGRAEYIALMEPQEDFDWWLELTRVDGSGVKVSIYEGDIQSATLMSRSRLVAVGDESEHLSLQAGTVYWIVMQYFGQTGIAELTEHAVPTTPTTSHNPIQIESDDDFTYENGVVQGNGTYEDPYVIEGWEIEADTASGISIVNTEAHFVIRDVYVSDGLDYGSKSGISLCDVTNGTVVMCTVTNCVWGIEVFSCLDMDILDNDLTSCYYGVGVVDSSEIDIYLNRISNSLGIGIAVNYTTGFWISNNTIVDSGFYGVDVAVSQVGFVASNIVAHSAHCGIRLTGHNEQMTLFHNTLLNNTVQAVDDNLAENAWNYAYPIGGNYWSDYSGVDLYSGPNQDLPGSDGIGDTPYTIGVFDQYPLMAPHPG